MIGRRALIGASALASLQGCGGAPPPPSVALTVKAAADVNADASGTPLPVAVRVFALASSGRFSAADAYSLMDRESAVLGDEGKRVEALSLRPGETKTLTMVMKPDVRYLGVAALYHDIDRARWRALAPIAPSGLTALVLLLGRRQATLEAA